LVNIFPKNPFNTMASGKILPTIFFSILFGIGVAFLRKSEDQLVSERVGIDVPEMLDVLNTNSVCQ